MIYMYTFNYYLFINVYCSVNKITFIFYFHIIFVLVEFKNVFLVNPKQAKT
jgi:hypothetical protein